MYPNKKSASTGSSITPIKLFCFFFTDKDRAIAALGGDDLKGNIMKHRGKMGTNSAALTEYDLGILIQQAEYELKGGNSEVNA